LQARVVISHRIVTITYGGTLEVLLQQLQESLLTHGRPVQIAFHVYEILSEAGYSDELIEEIAQAMTDIVA
jgi:hypothetical protein